MSDHYRCKVCHARHDGCRCTPGDVKAEANGFRHQPKQVRRPSFEEAAAHIMDSMAGMWSKPRSVERIPDTLAKIQAIWQESPDMRLGQLLVNALTRPDGALTENSLFNIEDDKLLAAIEEFAERRRSVR